MNVAGHSHPSEGGSQGSKRSKNNSQKQLPNLLKNQSQLEQKSQHSEMQKGSGI